MKILVVGDYEEKHLWGKWTAEMATRLSDVDLVLSAGDLSSYYLEFLTENLNASLVYVPGNHDRYIDNPPKRCINADGKIIDLKLNSDNGVQIVRIMGLGGSMRYKDGPYQYSEDEQQRRAEKLFHELDSEKMDESVADYNILLTHAPCKGYGDMDDLAHRGFSCFNKLLERWKPQIHCYGHVHEEYNSFGGQNSNTTGFIRLINHPSGTHLVNCYGYQFIVI